MISISKLSFDWTWVTPVIIILTTGLILVMLEYGCLSSYSDMNIEKKIPTWVITSCWIICNTVLLFVWGLSDIDFLHDDGNYVSSNLIFIFQAFISMFNMWSFLSRLLMFVSPLMIMLQLSTLSMLIAMLKDDVVAIVSLSIVTFFVVLFLLYDLYVIYLSYQQDIHESVNKDPLLEV